MTMLRQTLWSFTNLKETASFCCHNFFIFVSSPDSVVYTCICKENKKIKKIIKR